MSSSKTLGGWLVLATFLVAVPACGRSATEKPVSTAATPRDYTADVPPLGMPGGDRPVLLADVAELSTGGIHTCARTSAGEILCWGNNDYGQLGVGDTEQRVTPVKVQGLEGAVE